MFDYCWIHLLNIYGLPVKMQILHHFLELNRVNFDLRLKIIVVLVELLNTYLNMNKFE